MADTPGQKSGHEAGFTWSDYLDWAAAREGSLTAVAEKLSARRRFAEDITSIERALRRLRSRGQAAGGKWGSRLVDAFGLPDDVEARLHWMASYHSRFTDLPVAVCEDLVRLWDHPPATEPSRSRTALSIARSTLALRRNDFERALHDVGQARLGIASAAPEAQAEIRLVEAFIASRKDPAHVAPLLAGVEPLLA